MASRVCPALRNCLDNVKDMPTVSLVVTNTITKNTRGAEIEKAAP